MKTDRRFKRPLAYAFFCTLSLACWIACSQVCFAQQLEGDLLSRRVTLQVKNGSLLEALGRLAGQEAIPIGWELSQDDVVKHDINVDVEKTPLKDVLDLLIVSDPSYCWKVEDGVINFYPAFNRDERLQELLSVRVKEFNPPKGLSVFAFRDAILGLPEVQKFLLTNGLEASHGGNCCGGAIPYMNREFRTGNAELRALLNKLIRDGQVRIWIISRTGKDRQLIHLSL